MEQEFAGRTIVITGAASGMGLEASKAFAARGGAVVMCDINVEAAEGFAAEIRKAGGKAVAVKCDVRNYDEIAAAVAKGVSEFGSVDVTISFAGGEPARMLKQSGNFLEQTKELIDWGLEVNGRAPIYMAHAAFKEMAKQKRGVVISIGSIDGVTGGALVYSAAKSGLIGFTKSLARIGAGYGVRAVCVSPGPVMTRPGMAGMRTALGRAAEPKEIIDLILYLASDKAAFITGQNYVIDGGRACLYA